MYKELKKIINDAGNVNEMIDGPFKLVDRMVSNGRSIIHQVRLEYMDWVLYFKEVDENKATTVRIEDFVNKWYDDVAMEIIGLLLMVRLPVWKQSMVEMHRNNDVVEKRLITMDFLSKLNRVQMNIRKNSSNSGKGDLQYWGRLQTFVAERVFHLDRDLEGKKEFEHVLSSLIQMMSEVDLSLGDLLMRLDPTMSEFQKYPLTPEECTEEVVLEMDAIVLSDGKLWHKCFRNGMQTMVVAHEKFDPYIFQQYGHLLKRKAE